MRTPRRLLAIIPCLHVALAMPCLCRCAELDEILPLPQWSDGAKENSQALGALLLPDGMLHDDLIPNPSSLTIEEPPSATQFELQRPLGDLSLFLPDALLGKAIKPALPTAPTSSEMLRELDAEFLAHCLEAPEQDHLIDPDSHVSETQREDLVRFLDFHARDARIKAYVVVTDRDQVVPSHADLSHAASGAFAKHDSCLAVFPLGEPWRARLFVSRSVSKVAGPDHLAGMVEDCAKDAMQVSDPLEQLHRFTIRLSIRLFWLERMMGGNQPALSRVSAHDVPQDVIAKREAALTAALNTSEIESGRSSWDLYSVGLGMLLSLAGGAATYAALRHRRKKLLGYVWLLPEIEIPPRLGGAFSGGGGCSIRFR